MSFNPVPSKDPDDFLANVETLDEFVSSFSSTVTTRTGATRRTLAGINSDASSAISSFTSAGNQAIYSFNSAGNQVISNFENAGGAQVNAAQAARNEAVAARSQAESARNAAQVSATAAQTSAIAAQTSAQQASAIYPSVTEGMQATSEGGYFKVPEAGFIQLYRSLGGQASPVLRLASEEAVAKLASQSDPLLMSLLF